jgi:hypothetical protein
MKGRIAQAAAEVAIQPGCAFIFFIWGLEIVKSFFLNSEFGWGQILSCWAVPNARLEFVDGRLASALARRD